MDGLQILAVGTGIVAFYSFIVAWRQQWAWPWVAPVFVVLVALLLAVMLGLIV